MESALQNVSKKKKRSTKLTTVDIVLMAILAIVNGVAMTYLAMLNQLLTALGGPILTSITLGLYSISGVLAAYIIRKPGAAFFTLTLSGVVQIISGNPNGLIAITPAMTDGLGVELAFMMFRYKKWNWTSTALSGLFAVPIWFIIASFWFGYYKWGMGVLLVAFVIRCLSGVVLAGWLSKIIGDILVRTDILKGFNIAKQRKKEEGSLDGTNHTA
ncbi:ECF transporter S component [Fictibacillus sp. WQ 8-8]|uniref:ECF transporter S component n=1 Tax=Fictibacillus TaxID=1329200 RepID=UPI0006A7F0CA|nr:MULTISPECIES: ECF transporter S component [Fictibacillus]MCQ6268108.1 ECF transporter S component [Fictibacillus sp. WQ 8-8]MDM5200934.1 ECF transporter S component [Fictibacillus enclensis]